MARNNVENVSTGKPRSGGAVWVAPAGTTMPTDAVSELGPAWVNVGFISEDGVVFSRSEDSNSFRDWEGTEVESEQSNFSETMKMKFIETNEQTMKIVWGDDNVKVDEQSNLAVIHKGCVEEERAVVIDTRMKKRRQRRHCVPRAKLSSVGDVTYNRSNLVGYEVTFKNLQDDEGAASREYTGVRTDG